MVVVFRWNILIGILSAPLTHYIQNYNKVFDVSRSTSNQFKYAP